jgi:hypothetical protein
MADITDPESVQFTGWVRQIADKLGSLYYECRHLKNLKDADGDTATTIALRHSQIRRVSDMMIDVANTVHLVEATWFNVGTGSAFNVKITNTADVIADGSTGTNGRAVITGTNVHDVMNRTIDLDDWLNNAGFGGGGGGQRAAMFNTMNVVSSRGNNPLTVAQVNVFVDNRCTELIDEYEALGNAKLNHLLSVAVNPRNPVA